MRKVLLFLLAGSLIGGLFVVGPIRGAQAAPAVPGQCGPPVVTVGDASVAEGGQVVFTVTLSSPALVPVTVEYTTTGGTATADVDYNNVNSPAILNIPVGATSATIAVSTFQDALSEPSEGFTVDLANATNATVEGGDAQGTGTIVDNDNGGPKVMVGDVSANEGDPVNFALTLSAQSNQPVTVRVKTNSGTATADVDYNEINTFLDVVFAPGDTLKPLAIPTFDDATFEGSESFTLDVLSVTGPATLADGQAVGTIVDDDPDIRVSVADSSGPESGNVTFALSLSAPSQQAVTVRVKTISGTATGDVDYNQLITFFDVVFAPGEISKSHSIPVFQDNVLEGNEAFSLIILDITNARATDCVAQGLILDDECTAVTGNKGHVTLGVGTWCVSANVAGGVTISQGANVLITYSTIAGHVTANQPASLLLCSSKTGGGVSVTAATGPVTIGNPAGNCPGNTIAGTTSLTSNKGGSKIVGANKIGGHLICSGNVPSPTNNGQPNTVTGYRTGDCTGL